MSYNSILTIKVPFKNDLFYIRIFTFFFIFHDLGSIFPTVRKFFCLYTVKEQNYLSNKKNWGDISSESKNNQFGIWKFGKKTLFFEFFLGFFSLEENFLKKDIKDVLFFK